MDRKPIMDNKKYLLGLYEKSMPNTLTWVEKLNAVKKFGFDYLEISIDESDERLARLTSSSQEIRLAIEKTGVPIYSMCLSAHRKYPLGSKDEDISKRSLEIMEGAIDLAVDLGVRIIQLAGYDVYYEEGDAQTRLNFELNVNKCVLMASRKGVNLGFETMETPFMDTVEKAMRYVRLIDHVYLGIYPDIGNLKNASLLYNSDVNEDLMLAKGHLLACHLKETRPGKYREIPFGTGHTEYLKNIKALYSLGVRMFVGEFWYCANEDWKQTLAYANWFLRDKLNRVFDD